MFKWEEFIKVSKSLEKYAKVNSTVSEGFYRTAVSRAYYAAFHSSLSYAMYRGYDEKMQRHILKRKKMPNAGKHKVLISFLLDDPHPQVKQLGLKLQSSHDYRIKSDYYGDISIDHRFVQLAFLYTDSIHDLIPKLP